MTEPKDTKLETPYLNLTTMVFIAIFGLYPLFLISFFTGIGLSAITNSDVNLEPFIGQMTLVVLGSIWLFLRDPRMIIKKYQMEPLSKTNPEIVSRIAELAALIKLKEVPIVLRIPNYRKNTDAIYTFGTWRKKYIAVPENILSMNKETLDVILLHELGHIASGDIWKTGLAISYLKSYGVYTLFSLLTSIIILPINMPQSFRPVTILVLVSQGLATFFLFITIRFMYQIREYAADEYIMLNIDSNSLILKSFFEYGAKTGQTPPKINYINKFLNWLPEHHPGMKTRLTVMSNKSILDEQIPRFFLVLGLVVGQFTSLFANVAIGKIVVSWLILIPPFCLSLILATSHSKSIRDKIGLSIISVANLAIGTSLMFSFYVLPSVLFVDSISAGSSTLLTTPFGLEPHLAQFFDYIFIILFLIPIFLFLQTWIFEILSTLICSITNVNVNDVPIFAWLLQLPFNLFIFKSLQEWFLGQDVLLNTWAIFGLILAVWLIVVIVCAKIIIMKHKR